MLKRKVVALTGVTQSGKTALAVEIAKEFKGIILSADSRQVYQGLDVGTNKEGKKGVWQGQPCRVIDGIPQLLIDIAKPGEDFNLHTWLTFAYSSLELLWEKKRLPIVVGGTGLYLTALLEGYQLNGKKKKPSFESLLLFKQSDRQLIYQRNDERIVSIWEELIAEVKDLEAQGVKRDWLRNLGLDYKIACQFLSGELTKDQAILRYQGETHAYIRRQLTWWRHHGQITPVDNFAQAKQAINQFLDR